MDRIQSLFKTIEEFPKIEDLLQPNGFSPKIKTINKSLDFMIWREKLKLELHGVKQIPIVEDIITLLENGFQTGFSDEKDLKELKAKLEVLVDHAGDLVEPITLNGTIINTASAISENSSEIKIIKEIVINKKEDYHDDGGFAEIYRVIDPDTEMPVAFKIFAPSPFQGSDAGTMKKRFLREARKVLTYSHENIVKAYDFGFLGDDSGYIKLEFIDGKKLITYLREHKLDFAQKSKLALQYVSAMAYIHSKGDMHRDISYSNILVDDNDNIKVLDFGYARGTEDTEYDTQIHGIVPKFSPPDKIYDMRSEVYCIGAVLFSIFSGEDFHYAKMSSLQYLPQSIADIINKCMEIKAENRYPSAIELFEELKFVLTNKRRDINEKIEVGFSLDLFEQGIQELRKIEVEYADFPTKESIEYWVETEIPQYIQEHKFRSKMMLPPLIRRIPKVMSVDLYSNGKYEIEKDYIVSIYNTYHSCSEENKSAILDGIVSIVLEKTVERFPF